MSISQSDDIVVVEIIEDQSTDDIAQVLKEKNLIRNPLAFTTYSLFGDGNILPGIYYLKPNMNLSEIVRILNSGIVSEISITIPEGWRADDIAEYLDDLQLTTKDEFLKLTGSLEGYLFPDTYRVAVKTDAETIVKKLTENYNLKTKNSSPTRDELILASIVQREAANEDEMPTLAGVFQNRLDIGMKLDADPTAQYAKGSWEVPVPEDLTIDSPYNTYIYTGLPPGPISNPGLASIFSAQNPEDHNYYYFFHLADGTTVLSETKEEHESNIDKYRDQM